jgi:hypothetical protein
VNYRFGTMRQFVQLQTYLRLLQSCMCDGANQDSLDVG